MLSEITVINEPRQRLDTYLSDTDVSLELFWNETSGRWALSLDVEGERRLSGIRLLPGLDLLGPYDLNLGRLFVVDMTGGAADLGRDTLPSGAYRLIHDDDA